MQSEEEIVSAWIEGQEGGGSSRVYKKNFWAMEAMMSLPHEDPSSAWRIVKEIYSRKPSKKVIEILAAGPFEDVMCNCGEEIIGELEEMARNNAEFREFMSYVWLDRNDTSAHDRFFEIAGCEPPFD